MQGGGKHILEVKVIGQMDNTIYHTFEIPDADIWMKLKCLLGIDTDVFDEAIMTFEEKEGVFEKSERHYMENGLAPTLTSSQQEKIIVAMRGRNPDNSSDRTAGTPTEQRLEPNSQGLCNTLTSVRKDNLVMEKQICAVDEQNIKLRFDTFGTLTTDGSSPKHNNRVMETVRIEQATESQCCIRKLTPRECWRLMDFTDEDFRKAEEVNSNTQLYKQAGNSIVRNVLVQIIGQML